MIWVLLLTETMGSWTGLGYAKMVQWLSGLSLNIFLLIELSNFCFCFELNSSFSFLPMGDLDQLEWNRVKQHMSFCLNWILALSCLSMGCMDWIWLNWAKTDLITIGVELWNSFGFVLELCNLFLLVWLCPGIVWAKQG